MNTQWVDATNKRTLEKVKIPVLCVSEDEYHALDNESAGFCFKCGDVTYGGCEPDARRYQCDSCDEKAVFGIQESLVFGRIRIAAEGEEDGE